MLLPDEGAGDLALEGTVECPGCGTHNKRAARHCALCGEPLATKPDPARKR
jgi:predicted amidophosphoribosyltransferase